MGAATSTEPSDHCLALPRNWLGQRSFLPVVTSRLNRRVRRTAVAALTTALVTLLAIPLLATPAGAAPTATVEISQIPTQSLVISIDAGGTVTFINSIPATQEAVSLIGLASVTVETDVMLALPSGDHPLAFGQNFAERFDAPWAGSVTYSYRVTSRLPLGVSLDDVLDQLTVPVPTPMIVNTILPLPDLPLPPVNVPPLPVPGLPAPQLPDPGEPPVTPDAPGTPGTVPAIPGAPTGGTNSTGVTAGEQIMPSAGGPLVFGAPNGFAERQASTAASGSTASGP